MCYETWPNYTHEQEHTHIYTQPSHTVHSSDHPNSREMWKWSMLRACSLERSLTLRNPKRKWGKSTFGYGFCPKIHQISKQVFKVVRKTKNAFHLYYPSVIPIYHYYTSWELLGLWMVLIDSWYSLNRILHSGPDMSDIFMKSLCLLRCLITKFPDMWVNHLFKFYTAMSLKIWITWHEVSVHY